MNLIRLLDLLGVGVFAVSGVLTAGRKRLDLLGVGTVAAATAIGGGTVRDLLMNRTVFWFADPTYLLAIIVAAVLTMLYVRFRHPPERQLDIADAMGLALFAISGAQIAEAAQLSGLIIVVVATITATFGGVLRDVLCNEIPQILQHGNIYASTVIAGSALYVLLQRTGVQREAATLIGMATIFGLRVAAMVWNLRLPVFDLDRHRKP